MRELDGHRGRHDARVARVAELRGEQDQRRPESLAAGLHQVRGSVGEHVVLGLRGGAQALLDQRKPVHHIGRERCVGELHRNGGNHVGPLMARRGWPAGQS